LILRGLRPDEVKLPVEAYGSVGKKSEKRFELLESQGAFTPADYEQHVFRTPGAPDKTLLETQRLTSPTLLPSVYYASNVPHVVVKIGKNTSKFPTLVNAHLISMPITDPEAPSEPEPSDAGTGGD
jgi:hypothetical protein